MIEKTNANPLQEVHVYEKLQMSSIQLILLKY